MEINTIVNIVLSVLSFLLALISIITVIITIRQNKRLLEANERQIREMRKEHELSEQPIIVLEKEKFLVERPKLYYTPPFDEYEFISRYTYSVSLRNVSSSTAICIDLSAKIILEDEGKELFLGTVSERINILSAMSEGESMHILFAGDNDAYLYEALRERTAKRLPKLEIEIIYKNTCGGYFLCSQSYILAPQEDTVDMIRSWHAAIKGTSVEAKEIIENLREVRGNEKWRQVFNAAKEEFDRRLGKEDIKEIEIKLVEIPEKYCFKVLSQENYNQIIEKHSYPRYVHNGVPCCKESEK